MKTSIKLKKHEWWVIAAAAAIIALAVATTLMFSDALLNRLDARGDGAYKHVTFTDAVIQCQEKSRAEFKSRLGQLALDDHSSRFDAVDNRFKIFFNAELNTSDEGFYISCMVNPHTGRIADFEGAEKGKAPTEALRRNDGGLFGWPIKK